MSGLEYPFKWHGITEEEKAERAKMWTGDKSAMVGMARSEPLDIYMPKTFYDNGVARQVWNFKVRPADTFLLTYPKCGSTLCQEILWQLVNGCPIDSQEAKENVLLRVPFLEMKCLQTEAPVVPSLDLNVGKAMQKIGKFVSDPIGNADKMGDPRVMKTHLPFAMLPPDLLDVAKAVVVVRNVKDACASFYHHEQLLPVHALDKDVDFEDYAEKYMKGEVLYGSYWTFVKDCLRHKDHKNVLIVHYEDLRRNLMEKILEIAEFVGKPVPEGKLEPLLDYLHIDNFKKNDSVNMKPPPGAVPDEVRKNFNFIRKGKIADWKDHFKTPEKLEKFNQWIKDNENGPDGKPVLAFIYE